MAEETIELIPEVDVLFYFPYNLGFGTAHVPANEQEPLFAQVAAHLSRSYGSYEWKTSPFPELTGTILENGACLRGVPRQARSESHDFIAKQVAAAGGVLIGDVKEEVIYLAHGVGCVGITLRLQFASTAELAALPTLSLKVINALRTHPSELFLRKDFSRFQDAMEKAFSAEGTLYDMWGLLLRGQPRRGFIVCMSQAFVLRTPAAAVGKDKSAATSLTVPRAELATLLAPLTGFAPEEHQNILPNSVGIEFCSEGWDGAVALLSDPQWEPWVRFFWMYSTCSWSVLSDLNAYLYSQTRQMARSQTVPREEVRRIMTATRRIQHSLAVLAHEAVPTNLWDTQEQLAMHQGIFDAWGTQELLDSIERKVEYLSEQYENLNNLLRDAGQERMDWVMTTFTFLTFAGVLADCISSIDFNGQSLTTTLRLSVIFLGTLGVIAISAGAGYIMHRRRMLEP